MARGIDKIIGGASKAFQRGIMAPVHAVASLLKKKAVKRGPSAASAGLVRRKYKKRSAAPVRTKMSNDGAGNVRMAKAIGHQPRALSRNLESKIRDMLNPASHHLIENSGNVHVEVGKTVYTHFEMMNAEDIDQVIAQASSGNSSGALQKYNGKVNIQNAKLQLMLRNQTTNLVTLRVYEYICRRDLPDKIQESPSSATEVDGTTQSAIFYGFNYQAINGVNSSTIGGTLYQNPLFCTYYKIVRVKNIQLGAGKCFNLSLSNLKAKTINPLVYNATDGDVLAGHTRGFVIQAQGSLVGPSGDDMYGQPTTGFVNFDWFCSRKYTYNQPWSGVGRNTVLSNLPSPDKTWYHINEFQGAAQTQQQA